MIAEHGERRRPPAGADVRRPVHHPERPRAVPDHAGHGVRDGRRAQNITGSAKFRRLIESGDYEARIDVALEQVRIGANMIDVNMDADLLDSEKAMTTFLNLVATEPEIARVPIMIDSSSGRRS